MSSMTDPLNEVLPGKLWIGGAPGRAHLAVLGIQAVVSVMHKPDPSRSPILPEEVPLVAPLPPGVEEFNFPLWDDPFTLNETEVAAVFEAARYRVLDLIENQGKRVLVHCAAGASRSAAVVVACLMRLQKVDANKALAFLKEKRPCCQPNSLFMRVLRKLEY